MQTIQTDDAPQAIGPYSQAVKANGMLFVSGQIPLDKDGNLDSEDVEIQTNQVMKNLNEVLKAAGSSLDKVVKTTIFLNDMEDFARVNEAYATYFPKHKPARATVEVSRLPKDVLVEIDCIAII